MDGGREKGRKQQEYREESNYSGPGASEGIREEGTTGKDPSCPIYDHFLIRLTVGSDLIWYLDMQEG